MKRKNAGLIGLLAGAASVAGAGGCGGEMPLTASCDSTLYATPFAQGFGGFSLGIHDLFHLEGTGFEIVDGHAGGMGDTLEWGACRTGEDYGVRMQWSYGNLHHIGVTEGWHGETDRGLRLGASIPQFREVYPEATENELGERTGSRSFTVRGGYSELFTFDPETGTLDSIWLSGGY